MLNTGAFSWSSYARTDVGKVRQVNEDAVLDHEKQGLWVVADGMGGYTSGDVASSAIIETLEQIQASDNANSLITEIENRMIEVNQELLYQAAQQANKATIGSTVAIMLAFHKKMFALWVGDSRIYRLRNGQLSRITVDHSQAENLVDEGSITEEDVTRYPDTNVVTRAIGAGQSLYVDIDMHEVISGDRYLLCSDGLYKEVLEQEMPDLIALGTPQEACNALTELTLQRGSRDNVSVIVVQVD